MSIICWWCCCCHWVVSCTWVSKVFWISPVRMSSAPSLMLMLSRSWRAETDCRGLTGGGKPSESEEYIDCQPYLGCAHSSLFASCQPDPPASYGCGGRSQPEPYSGENPGACSVGPHPAYCVCGEAGMCGGWRAPDAASRVVRLRVSVPETLLLRASSCGTRGKVSTRLLYRRSPRLGNWNSFVYPGKKNIILPAGSS